MLYMIGSRPYHGPDNVNFSQSTLGFYTELPELCCIKLQGVQALQVLQGQVSNDVLNIAAHTIQNNLICNLKGQIIAKIRVFQHQEQICMICPSDLCEEVLNILAKPAAFGKVKLQPLDIMIYGIFQPKIVEDSFYALTDQAYLSFVPASHLPQKTSLEWHYQRLLSQDFEIYPETSRMFHPHDLELEKNNWINFNKGCYRGQEIIARMHYRGKRKYQLKLIEQELELSLQPGLELSTGIVVDFCPIQARTNLILLRSKIS